MSQEKKPLISIVVPVYNVELYLNQCVDSILAQSFKNYELILVDDGSYDSSSIICDNYANEDERIHVIHKTNAGSSDARNIGIENSWGEYIIFVDSDDYWEGEDSLAELVEIIQKDRTDVILFGCKDFLVDKNKMVISRIGYNEVFLRNHNIEENIRYLFDHNLFPGSAWLLAVKRNLIIQRDIFFEKGIKAEDYDWLINIFTNIKTVAALNRPFYVYRKGRKQSITGTADIKSIQSILFIIRKWMPILEKNDSLKNKYFLSHLAYIYMIAILIYSKIDKKSQKAIFNCLCDVKRVLKYSRRYYIFTMLLRIVGVKYCTTFLRIIQ